jgi:hypothetical protein
VKITTKRCHDGIPCEADAVRRRQEGARCEHPPLSALYRRVHRHRPCSPPLLRVPECPNFFFCVYVNGYHSCFSGS